MPGNLEVDFTAVLGSYTKRNFGFGRVFLGKSKGLIKFYVLG